MNTATVSNSNSLKINYFYILLLIGFAVSFFFLAYILSTKQSFENTLEYDPDDIAELAEEIYNAGTITEAVKNLPIDAALVKKMIGEIERQLTKTEDCSGYEVYFLHARQNTQYPILGYGNEIIDQEYMRIGDVWKVGITKNGESGRYNLDAFYKNPEKRITLNRQNLQYQYIHKGTYKQCIILEKLLIYTYSLWSGHSNLIKPPGCKIFR